MKDVKPDVGDIWCWDNRWHVLVVEEISYRRYTCICLEDGEISAWTFGGDVYNHWRQKA